MGGRAVTAAVTAHSAAGASSPMTSPPRRRPARPPATALQTYNYMGGVYNKLIACFKAGDLAGALAHQRTGQRLIDLLNDPAPYGGAAVFLGKEIMQLRLGGKHCGPPRLPLAPMAPAAVDALRADLTKLGFWEY